MDTPLFTEEVIAVIWDFDETLIPGNMQKPLFEKYQIVEKDFWDEVDALPDTYTKQGIRVSPDTLYLNQILTYVKKGRFKGLTNEILRELGGRLEFFPGLPEFFPEVAKVVEQDEELRAHHIEVEHYIVSTGLRQMILGTRIAEYVRDVWGCEFVEELADPDTLPAQKGMPLGPQSAQPSKRGRRRRAGQPVLGQVAYSLDNTTKTRAVFEINKGTNVDPAIDVNASIKHEDRRVPFHNMIYIADGPSDIPVFSILNQYGGKTFAVYPAGSQDHFAKVYDLQEQGRVQGIGEAKYQHGSQTYLWITHSVRHMAKRIVSSRLAARKERVHAPPGHIVQQAEPAAADEDTDDSASDMKSASV
ncbi:MAG: haloacid dehalogenase-like hydrolase [Chloroflexi bacterium]|nr:haloacid dehalogenase-like hydrolase [Chloroflexota bacterium]